MSTTPSPTVFQTGPDSTLNVVDVYDSSSISTIVKALEQQSTIENGEDNSFSINDIKSLAGNKKITSAVKQLLENPQAEISLERINSIGLTKQALTSLAPNILPASVDVGELINIFENCGRYNTADSLGYDSFIRGWNARQSNKDCKFGFNEFTQLAKVAAKFFQSEMGLPFNQLNTESAFTYMDSIRKTLIGVDTGELATEEELLSAGIAKTDTRASVLNKLYKLGKDDPLVKRVLKLSFDAGKRLLDKTGSAADRVNGVDSADLTAPEKIHVKKQLAFGAARKGDDELLKESIVSLEGAATPMFKRQTLQMLLSNYRLPSIIRKSQHSYYGQLLFSNVRSIETTAFLYSRENANIIDYGLLRYASVDARAVLSTLPTLATACMAFTKVNVIPRTPKAVINEFFPDFYMKKG